MFVVLRFGAKVQNKFDFHSTIGNKKQLYTLKDYARTPQRAYGHSILIDVTDFRIYLILTDFAIFSATPS